MIVLATLAQQLLSEFPGGTLAEYLNFREAVLPASMPMRPVSVIPVGVINGIGQVSAHLGPQGEITFRGPVPSNVKVVVDAKFRYALIDWLPAGYLNRAGETDGKWEDSIRPNQVRGSKEFAGTIRLGTGLAKVSARSACHAFFADYCVAISAADKDSPAILEAVALTVGGTVERIGENKVIIQPNAPKIQTRALATLRHFGPERLDQASVLHHKLMTLLVESCSAVEFAAWVNAPEGGKSLTVRAEAFSPKALAMIREYIGLEARVGNLQLNVRDHLRASFEVKIDGKVRIF